MIVVLANTVSSCLVDGPVHFLLEVERSLGHPLSLNMLSVKCPRCVVPHVDRVCTKSSYRCTTTLSLAWNPPLLALLSHSSRLVTALARYHDPLLTIHAKPLASALSKAKNPLL